MRTTTLLLTVWLTIYACHARCQAEELLFEDDFEGTLSAMWQLVGLSKEDYRLRDGKLQLKVQRSAPGDSVPMLKVDLPFKTSDTLTASVEVDVVDKPLRRAEFAGLCLTDKEGQSFTCKKINIDGYHLLSPGHVNFIGKPGEEGDPNKYSVKYWPADKAAGPLRIVVRDNYAYFQVGPATDNSYKTFFHSAISETNTGLGFALFAGGATSSEDCWVSFDRFRVWKH